MTKRSRRTKFRKKQAVVTLNDTEIEARELAKAQRLCLSLEAQRRALDKRSRQITEKIGAARQVVKARIDALSGKGPLTAGTLPGGA